MRIAIIGYGAQGKSAYEYWQKGNDITICSRRPIHDLPESVDIRTGDDHLKNLDAFDLIVRSPGMHPRVLVEQNGPDILDKVTTNTNEFMRICPTKNVIGVTGTKGKGTTSTMIARILEACGKRVHLGGNIGIPPLELLKNTIQPDDYVVLELANFQLIDLKYSPHIAVCLMVVPEHLDWHSDIEEYYHSKSKLFAHQEPKDKAIYFADSQNSHDIASVSTGAKIPYYAVPGAYVKSNEKIIIDGQPICDVDKIKLLGRHNWQNICAAITAVWQISQDRLAIQRVVTNFTGLPYRLQFVREIGDVRYYNDSFGTTPETAIVALQAFEQPVVLIVGGSDKGVSFDELINIIQKSRVRAVIAVGDTGEKIAKKLQGADFPVIENMTTMTEIVSTARDMALPGDVVLLSAGSASFGLFKDYKDRGDQFTQAVKSLA